jgi:hypothetical protein
LKVVLSMGQLAQLLTIVRTGSGAGCGCAPGGPGEPHASKKTRVSAKIAAGNVVSNLRSLYQGEDPRGAKMALRITKGPTDACIPFHCDGAYATSTTQIALNDDYRGGRLVYWTFGPASAPEEGVLHITHRPAGTVTHHAPTILHAVTRLESGERCSFFVLDKANGLGEKDVLDLEHTPDAHGGLVDQFCDAFAKVER